MGGEDVLLTLDEAVQLLDPSVDRAQLKSLVEATGLQPQGTRRKLGPGRPALTYRATDLMRLHAAIAPLMHEFAATGAP